MGNLSFYRTSSFCIRSASGIALLVGLLTSATLVGQDDAPPAPAIAPVAAAIVPAKYESVPVAEAFKSDKVVREKERVKDEMLRGGSGFNERDINDFYTSYLVPRMTSTETPELCNDSRREIFEDMDRAERSEAILKPFNEWLLKVMGRVAIGNYQPSAGINATLVIGRLNDVRASNNAPKPMAKAAGALLNLAVSGRNDGVRAAALDGLERHMKLGQASWSENQKQMIAEKLIKTLSESQPAKRSNRSHAWLLGRSLELLTQIKHKNEEQVYLYAIDRMADKTTDPLLLEKALLVVGSYKPPAVKTEVATVATSNTLNHLVSVSQAWHDSLVDPVSRSSGSPGPGYEKMMIGQAEEQSSMMQQAQSLQVNPYGMPKKKEETVRKPNPYATQSYEVKVKRRELHQLLETVRFGIDGIHYGATIDAPVTGLATVIADTPNKPVLAEILTAVEEMQSALNDGEIKDKISLGTKTQDAFDALIAAATRFPGVIDVSEDSLSAVLDPAMTDDASEVGTDGEENLDVNGEAIPAENAADIPSEVVAPPTDDGFGS